IGKTTVAVSVAHALAGRFEGGVCFVDLGAVEDPDLLPDTVASNLRLTIQARDASPAIVAYLQKSRMLLVLDNCEHVIDVAARLAELIFSKAPGVHILATSREALRVEGERAYLLPALDCPPVEVAGTRADILAFPAATLFLDRARASGCNPELHDVNLRIIAAICGRLDGIPLAIELAAARVGTYGLEGTARLLKRRLGLHWRGKRTALPRHQTLHALLQWSHALLAKPEQVVLRRLAIFVGTFSLDAAVAVASDEEASE